MSPIPTWLAELLEATGRSNPDGVSRAARATFCRSCGQAVIRGLDDDTIGLAATVDPQPLDPTGEVLALVAGRGTYRLRWAGDRYELDHRDQWSIAATPAGQQPDPKRFAHIVAEHCCGTALPHITAPDPRPATAAAPSLPEF